MKALKLTALPNQGWEFAHPFGGWLGAKFGNGSANLTTICLTLPNLFYYIYGRRAADPQTTAQPPANENVGLVGWAVGQNRAKALRNKGKTLPNLAHEVGHLPNLGAER